MHRLQELLKPNLPCQGRGQARKWQQISSPAAAHLEMLGDMVTKFPPNLASQLLYGHQNFLLPHIVSSISHGSSVNGKYFTKEWLVDILPLGNNLSKN